MRMKTQSIVIGLVFAAFSVLLLNTYLRKYEKEMSGGERVKLLVARKAVPRGTLLTEDVLGTREVPIAYVEARAVRASDQPKVIGVQLAQAVEAQDVLMWSDLAIAIEHRDLSSLVQPGNRAVTVHASAGDDTRTNALIHPGDYVDVLATMGAGKSQDEVRSAVVLLQKVLVLAVGLATSN